jgi:hypothetical protein
MLKKKIAGNIKDKKFQKVANSCNTERKRDSMKACKEFLAAFDLLSKKFLATFDLLSGTGSKTTQNITEITHALIQPITVVGPQTQAEPFKEACIHWLNSVGYCKSITIDMRRIPEVTSAKRARSSFNKILRSTRCLWPNKTQAGKPQGAEVFFTVNDAFIVTCHIFVDDLSRVHELERWSLNVELKSEEFGCDPDKMTSPPVLLLRENASLFFHKAIFLPLFVLEDEEAFSRGLWGGRSTISALLRCLKESK